MKKIKKNRYERIEFLGYTYLRDIQFKNMNKIKKNRYERIELYIKDITKQVFLKDLGFTYLQY